MDDIIFLLTIFLTGYIASMIILFLLGKLFFPFLSKEEMQKQRKQMGLKR